MHEMFRNCLLSSVVFSIKNIYKVFIIITIGKESTIPKLCKCLLSTLRVIYELSNVNSSCQTSLDTRLKYYKVDSLSWIGLCRFLHQVKDSSKKIRSAIVSFPYTTFLSAFKNLFITSHYSICHNKEVFRVFILNTISKRLNWSTKTSINTLTYLTVCKRFSWIEYSLQAGKVKLTCH